MPWPPEPMRHLPNALTIARILLTPFIGLALAGQQARAAFWMVFVAGFSDLFDGWAARRFGWGSKLGAILDPLADKFMLATVYLGLAAGGALPWWIVWLVLGRDLAILAFGAWAWRRAAIREFPPTAWGKVSTFCQMALAGWTMMGGAFPGLVEPEVITISLWLAAAATVWSALHYGWVGWRALREASIDAAR